MIAAGANEDGRQNETLFDVVTAWASAARPTTLGTTMITCAILIVAWRTAGVNGWPFAAALVSVAAISAWGLLEQLSSGIRTPFVAIAERMLAATGILAALAAAFGFLFWILGPAPVL
jgi:hypothetical protein